MLGNTAYMKTSELLSANRRTWSGQKKKEIKEAAARLRKAEAKAKPETITQEQYQDIRDAVEALNRVLEKNGETGYHMDN